MALNGGRNRCHVGVDTPLAVLSNSIVPFRLFQTAFAQVTNPPIDAIREEDCHQHDRLRRKRQQPLKEQPENCPGSEGQQSDLTNDMLKIKHMKVEELQVAEVPITYYKAPSWSAPSSGFFVEVDKAYSDGANIWF